MFTTLATDVRKSRMSLLSFFAAAFAALIALSQPASAQSTLAQPAPGQPAAAAKPPALVPLEQAFLKAATTLFESIPAGQKTVVVIDPLVDGVTGIQSRATRGFDRRIAQLVAERYKHIEIAPLTPENVARARYVFIGTFNTINNAGQATGPRDAFWICFALVDQQSKTVHARSVARATLSDVDIAPASFFADTPVWGLDSATTAYIETCQRAKPGDPVSTVYLDQLPAAARIREATVAYEAGDARRALTLYREAQALSPGDQLRTLNGVYLAYTALGEKEEASKAFAQLVEGGLKLGRLGVLFLFESGTTDFNADARVSAQYPDWLGEIASRAGQANACLQVVGHASRTGTEPFNERLSLDRAQRIVALLAERAPGLAARLKPAGSGSREVLVGLPRDDASTALDRRVEFKPASCA
ncbi:MAG: OmpA family protein [Beijerinckiaceae bacterium]|nr:OmpA family protein [Beijerinckiaceae bacterium]